MKHTKFRLYSIELQDYVDDTFVIKPDIDLDHVKAYYKWLDDTISEIKHKVILEQFVGVSGTKRGKIKDTWEDIYEGDIVQVGDEETAFGPVIFLDEQAKFVIDCREQGWGFFGFDNENLDYTIIGNIHDKEKHANN